MLAGSICLGMHVCALLPRYEPRLNTRERFLVFHHNQFDG
jgi:hypothetical protein